MSVSATVVALADLIEARLRPEAPRERLQLQILRLMPLYVQIWDLPSWESAFQAVMGKDEPQAGSAAWMLEHVFDFGRGNMYAAFSEATAKSDYAFMRADLLNAGVEVPEVADLQGW